MISGPIAAGGILRRKAIERLIQGLSEADIKKIGIYCPTKPGDPGTYVHSKMWIFDDECAIVGSANCNNRGYFHDSEMMGRVSEASLRTFADGDLNFAHKLRMKLWEHHLNGFASIEALYDPSTVFYFRQQLWSLAVLSEDDDFGRWQDYSKWDDNGFYAKWLVKHPIGHFIEGSLPEQLSLIDP